MCEWITKTGNDISISHLFFIINIIRRWIRIFNFKRYRKICLFNIFFLIEGGSIQIKQSSNNMSCMRYLFIMENFIRECRVQLILRVRTWGDVGFSPCSIFYFLHTKIFFQIFPKLKWIFNRIYEMMYIWRHCQAHDSISSIKIIHPVNLLFIRLRLSQSTNGDIKETFPLQVCAHFWLPINIVERR